MSAVTESICLETLAACKEAGVILARSAGQAAEINRRLRDAAAADAAIEQCVAMEMSRWAAQLWDAGAAPLVVLRPVQLQALARQVIRDSKLLPSQVLATAAIELQFLAAFALAEDYCINDDALPRGILRTPEQAAFVAWRSGLRESLAAQQSLASAQLCSALAAAGLQDCNVLPRRLVLAPGYTPSAAAQLLIGAARAAGVAILQLEDFGGASGVCVKYVAAEPASEAEAVARWLAQLYASSSSQLPLRTAVVLPEGQDIRGTLDRALQRYLHAELLVPAAAGDYFLEPWQFADSGGLADFPVVQIALDIIGLCAGMVPLEQLSRVLRSGFIAAAESERVARADIDRRLREELPGRVRLALAASRLRGDTPPAAWQPFAALLELLGEMPRRDSPAAWAGQFNLMLKASGWPNRDSGDGVVDQCRKALAQALDVLRSLDHCLPELSAGEAVQWLREIVAGKRFELRREQPAPIQILSFDSAADAGFDAVWVMGLTNAAFPRSCFYSPFIPAAVLAAAGVPRTDARAALAEDQAQMQLLLRAAPQICISHAAHDGNEVVWMPSPLVDWQCPEVDLQALPAVQWQAQFAMPATDEVEAMSAAETKRLAGGSGIFRDYALSPFVAFCRYRLKLRPFPVTSDGLDPATQGNWVHDALEFIWRELKDSTSLQALSDAELQVLVGRALDAGLPAHLAFDDWHGEVLMQIERERLRSVLSEWLEYEKTRALPFAVVRNESETKTELYGLPLTLRLDRVDRISGDKTIVIDYKTGSATKAKLSPDKLQEPQLPLYAISEMNLGQPVNGIALAQVSAKHGYGFYLISDWQKELVARSAKSKLACDPAGWATFCSDWDQSLAAIAGGFLDGEIRMSFAAGERAFDYQQDIAPYWSYISAEPVDE